MQGSKGHHQSRVAKSGPVGFGPLDVRFDPAKIRLKSLNPHYIAEKKSSLGKKTSKKTVKNWSNSNFANFWQFFGGFSA